MLVARSLCVTAIVAAGACAPSAPEAPPAEPAVEVEASAAEPLLLDPNLRPYELNGPLVPATASMVSAWDIPDHPPTSTELDGAEVSARVRRGYRLFMNTSVEASRLTPSGMSCGNCHLNAGQRELALPLVGSAGMFPEYNRRAGYDFSLEDRIVGCFMRSMNATDGVDEDGALPDGRVTPSPELDEIGALADYIRWVSRNHSEGENPAWRKQNRIPPEALIPIDELDPIRGEELFTTHCTQCHGADGQGVQIGDKLAGPLWGPRSWNDGAGAARVYTLAGIIRFMMPYLNPGVLTDEEAQQIAAFITSKPRPSYPYKAQDYQTEPRPIDAVYYDREEAARGR
ncbi:MAG: c-type cytochrome [Acidobacteria bacterium]|nr:c-type cytochrome [Acidobacteriota bacterium]